MSNVIIYDTYNVNVTIENDEVVGVQVVAGFIHDVIAGTNISIDKTDPLNPVISSSGGGSMTYPGAGIPLSTGSAWGTSITDNSANWNTAFGWGNHASAGYITLTGTQNLTGNKVLGGAFTLELGTSGNELTALYSRAGEIILRSSAFGTPALTLAALGSLRNGGFGFEFSPSQAAITNGVGSEFKVDGTGFTLTIGSDATGDIYYRNSSGYLTRLAAGTNGHVLTLAAGIPSWAAPSGGGWALTGTSTLTGAVDIVGSSSNTIKHTFPSLGTTQTDGAGLWLANTTAAAAGAQQISPSLVLEGQGWKTNATAASQSVKYKIDVLPVQGAANPYGVFGIGYSVNNSAYTSALEIGNFGTVTVKSALSIEGNNYIQYSDAGSLYSAANKGLSFRANNTTTAVSGGMYRFWNTSSGYAATSGTQIVMGVETNFVPTSGTAVFNAFLGSGTINQTGGANGDVSMFALTPTYTAVGGDVYGFRYAPTVTSVTGVHYCFSATSGSMLIGGTTLTTNAILDLQSTSRAFIPPRMTAAQRDAIGTPSIGMVVYNTDTNVLNFYNGGAWGAV